MTGVGFNFHKLGEILLSGKIESLPRFAEIVSQPMFAKNKIESNLRTI